MDREESVRERRERGGERRAEGEIRGVEREMEIDEGRGMVKSGSQEMEHFY